jgi:hypothetical protein
VNATETQVSSPRTLIAAALILMTHHARTGCPRLALCISRHLQCLAVYPEADAVIRDTCAALHAAWMEAACENRTALLDARFH